MRQEGWGAQQSLDIFGSRKELLIDREKKRANFPFPYVVNVIRYGQFDNLRDGDVS